MKIIQIDGIKGLVTALFIGVCTFAGFVIFPGQVAMTLWNKYLASSFMFPTLNLMQGVLLWGIAAISYCIVSKKGFAVTFKNTPELSDEELDAIMKSAKLSSQIRMINRNVSKFDKFEMHNKKDLGLKNTNNEKDTSYISSPMPLNNSKNIETKNDETISNSK